ncbi:mitochondrial pyruvate carrier 2 like protein [Verticillium longisporum]|uniref:Mitochondrial pyruvate carrier n=1 Tax=Verticillium longisporum TaxID=100787 RepID=A0A0G4MYD2_VERLO|nr:mitochondrial pyruvate carrier 2 like protein [Verticillium longisporum]CRK27754.1 hypothetical protein BN1708_014968 [Verticillium longisporum]CRK39212.1 hypothetical protein BN1723_004499 [Verticillium longisporum]
MAPTTNIFRASRPIFQQQMFTGAAGARTRAAFQNPAFRARIFREGSKRWQSADAGAESQAQQSWFKRMWDSPIGLKTVHFWAPVMKWAIVIAGISDFFRPAEKLSLTQNGALTATGLIWTRWCLIIKPRNVLLATVNFFMGIVGIIQVTRILMYEQSKKGSVAGVVEDLKQDVKDNVPNPIKDSASSPSS